MEQSSEESEDSELNFYEGNDHFKLSKNESFLGPPTDPKIFDHDIQKESVNLVSKDENGLPLKRKKLQEVKEFMNQNRNERGRAKSVGRDVRKSTKTSPKKTKRSLSLDRSELKTERGSMDKSESSEKEEELNFFTKMTDKKRNRFIQKMGLKPKPDFQEKHQDEICHDHKHRRKSRSRSRSREKDCQRSRKRTREIKERQRHGEQTCTERSQDPRLCKDRRGYRDQSRYSHFRDHGHAENQKEIPCKYFNDAGFCKYNSGHPDQFGNPKLHICAACFYERGQKRLHSQFDCFVVDEACMYYNNFGDCEYKSGHLSMDGKYARNHICRICLKFGEKRYHPAIHCKYQVNKYCKDSPVRERYQLDDHKRNHSKHNDEKPCSFYNNKGSCKFASGHYPGSGGGYTRQLHICSCCLEFLGEDKNHPAANCNLKKKLSEGRRMDLVADGATELPCNSFNSGNCVLKSGHCLQGETRLLHICKFCFEYRGEQNYHTQEECKLKKKLLKEVEYERQSKYVYSKKKEVDQNNGKETRDEKSEKKIVRKTLKERSSTRCTEKSGELFRGHRLTRDVTHQDEKNVNSEETWQLKTANERKVKAKTSQVDKECAKVSPCHQPKHMEEAINQTKPNVNEADEHETFLEMTNSKTERHDFGDTNLKKRDFDETEQETSTESDEGKGLNLTKTVLKEKEQASELHSKEKMHSGDACVNNQEKVHNAPLIERNPFYHNVKSKSNKGESGKKRRKLERCTPQTVISLTDSSDIDVNIREINEKRENPCEEGLLPVDDVLKISNVEVGNVYSEIEMNENEILKKIENLKKLHMIEVEKLRKARQQTGEVTDCAQEFS